MADVTITVNGKTIKAPAGTLLIEACKQAGIEIPAFCYYPGLSLQGACRMCLVEIEKMPKLQTACTTPITEGMVVQTESEKVVQSRKAMLELLLANHPLDCPVCDAGGECELQDMTFKYGAAESKYIDIKSHRDEQQWSPVVFYDRPRCIMCYRCVRVCGEGMDVWALGVQGRGQGGVIAPNKQDHLECEECGMCIDICPVGALTSGSYRYKTRPWEMNHVGTVCTHCGDGCLTTVGVRRSETGMEIVRCDNRDHSGVNGDFLCVKGRYGFDFANHAERITRPLIKRDGKFVEVPWIEALEMVASRFKEVLEANGPQAIGVVGSNRTTNEENYLLQKFARTVLGTNNIDHHRTADFPAFVKAVTTHKAQTASMRDLADASSILLIGNDPTEQHPLVAWQIRTNIRLHHAKLYVANSQEIKLTRQATQFAHLSEGGEAQLVSALAGDKGASKDLQTFVDAVRGEQNLVIIFGSELRGAAIDTLVSFAAKQSAKVMALADYANSRGAADMGLFPDILPGYEPLTANTLYHKEWSGLVPASPGLDLPQMLEAAQAGRLQALYVVGSNPLARYGLDPASLADTFVVVQEMFLTETARAADVILPAANAYEKSGTFTNTAGDVQLVKKAGEVAGTKSDFEIIVRIADRMGYDVIDLVPFAGATHADMGQSRGAQSGEADRHSVWLKANNMEPKVSPFDPMAMLDEIERIVPGYAVSRLNLLAGNDVPVELVQIINAAAPSKPELIAPAHDTLYTSGTLGRYSKTLNSVMENRQRQPQEATAD